MNTFMMPFMGILDKDSAPMDHLPPILPKFFVPRLTDKPQNPILDTVKESRAPSMRAHHDLPPELTVTLATSDISSLPRRTSNLWLEAMARNSEIKSQVLSWDRLRPSHSNIPSSTGFLSEQGSLVFAAARYHVRPPLRDPSTTIVYVTQKELLIALKMTTLGTSSVFHVWDPTLERFVQAGIDQGKHGLLIIDGGDEVISESLVARFLTIGTLLRRLENFVAILRARSAHEGPTVHAYAHALSTVVAFLRNALALCPPANDQTDIITLSAIWMQYGRYEEILIALSSLYEREETRLPQDYPVFDPSPAPLLSRIYHHLNAHLERQSPKVVNAIIAFILTTTSHEYLQQVSRSVGYGLDRSRKPPRLIVEKPEQYILEDDEYGDKDEVRHAEEPLGDTFPEFFPPELQDILLAAQKSLVLLQAAQPDHPFLHHDATQRVIRWFWTTVEIEAAWHGIPPHPCTDTMGVKSMSKSSSSSSKTTIYKPELTLFRLFDLEPGETPISVAQIWKGTSPYSHSLQSFIDTFPEVLPGVTPTLTHLSSLVLSQLIDHVSALSATLLRLFLSLSGTLNFQAHLLLLRSYLLVTAPPFKSRLAAALFSDSESCEVDAKAHSMAVRSLHRKPARSKKVGDQMQTQPWAVGLAPALLERETWPPVGGDLSFFLRTVIVDSFEGENLGDVATELKDKHDSPMDVGVGNGRQKVFEEAEYRLGFAIRDLPTGTGKEKWLNPLSIEALDFLYMDYKPPHPVDVLITPEILSKYQRMFAFILRLMRVESALGALFRMSRSTSNPLFPTLAPASKRLLHFRFVAHSFVSALSSYVFDTAIKGNFDPFIARLTRSSSSPDFSDVFALAKAHSALLDDILTACLLRSGQKAVGEVLRSALELILESVVVVGELWHGRMEEYKAAVVLEDLEGRFLDKMSVLTKVLKGLADKSVPSTVPLQGSMVGDSMARRPVGGTDALYHLLIKLDIGKWWSASKGD